MVTNAMNIHAELKVLEEANYQSLDEKRAVIDAYLANKMQELLDREIKEIIKRLDKLEDK